MLRVRSAWIRGLRLYRAFDDGFADDERVHAVSRFRSVDDPERFAIYSVRDVTGLSPLARLAEAPPNDHTLMVVREFRRVPLDASVLALALFTARPGQAAQVIVTLAHWAERAVSLYQPAYLLLAHSLEQPRICALLTGVDECHAFQVPRAAAFSLDVVMPEVRPLLVAEPEWYAYCREDPRNETLAAASPAISPYAV